MTVRAVVINIHFHGATVRLADGSFAAVPSDEFAAHRPAYVTAFENKASLELVLSRKGRYASVGFDRGHVEDPLDSAPDLEADSVFEERMDDYLRATQEWAPADRPDPAQRHFIRKKRRAAFFEARNKPA